MSPRCLRLAPIAVLVTCVAIGAAQAADERFEKTSDPDSGFLVVSDPLYRAECGSCHFAYSPGMLPERSWKWMMGSLGTHYGESVKLSAANTDALTKYLVDNAADKSKFHGSQIFMVRLSESTVPKRVTHIPHMLTLHRVVVDAIGRSNKVQVRRLTNCGACHTRAEEGSFGQGEVSIAGLPWGTGYNVKR